MNEENLILIQKMSKHQINILPIVHFVTLKLKHKNKRKGFYVFFDSLFYTIT